MAFVAEQLWQMQYHVNLAEAAYMKDEQLIKTVTNKFAIYSKCRKCKGNHENVQDHDEKLHDDVETVTDFSYLDSRISSGGGCDAAVTCRTRLGLVKLRNCPDLLGGKSFL